MRLGFGEGEERLEVMGVHFLGGHVVGPQVYLQSLVLCHIPYRYHNAFAVAQFLVLAIAGHPFNILWHILIV